MNSGTNKNQEWYKFLGEVAKEVDGLIIDSDNLNEFRQQIHPFAEKWKNHISDCKEYDRTCRKHWENVKANPKWQDKQAGPPEEGWEWDKAYLFDVGTNIGPVYGMPAKHAPALMASIGKYIERNEKEIHRYPPTSAEYQNLEQAIAEQKQNVVEIQAQFDKLSPKQKNKAWIKVPPDLEKRPPNRVYLHVK